MEERRWEKLPFDCLVYIFSKLGLEDLIIGVALVCKSWHGASSHTECWKILDFQDLDFNINSEFIAKFKQEYRITNFSFASFMKLCISKSHGSATKLTIPSTISSSFHQDLNLASIECPRLKVLALPSMFRENDKHIPGLIARWKDLEVLELKWKPVYFLDFIKELGANCPKFAELHLRGVFYGREAEAIVKCLPKLRSLVMRESFLKTEDLLTILDGCKELQEVDFWECRGFKADDEKIKKASAGIKKFVCEVSKEDENYTKYYDYAYLYLAHLFEDHLCK